MGRTPHQEGRLGIIDSLPEPRKVEKESQPLTTPEPRGQVPGPAGPTMPREPERRPHEDDRAARAEEVRAYLVSLRGGAPFLSGADSRLLCEWLDADVPVPTILSALDRVAARRRKKRTQSRLSLEACRGEVKKLLNRTTAGGRVPGSRRSAERFAESSALDRLIECTRGMKVAPRDRLAFDRLVQALEAIETEDAEQQAREAIRAARAFHEAVWDALPPPERQDLDARARAELEALAGVLSEEAFERAIEEVARDLARQRYPIVSAQFIWDTLAP